MVELLDRTQQTEVALLDQLDEVEVATGELAGLRDDESQVRLDHAFLRALAVEADATQAHLVGAGQRLLALAQHLIGGESGLVPLGQVRLVLLREQLVASGIVEVLAHEVGREGARVLRDVLGRVVSDVVDDLEAGPTRL